MNRAEALLREYYRPYLDLARKHDLGFVLETPTWRASADWGFRLGYSQAELMALNKRAVHFLQELSTEYQSFSRPIVISGNIGPRGDGYKAENCMSADEAHVYHRDQIQALATADADIITAMTINYSNEAIGIVQAAKFFGIPVVISFTVETDGRLPNGETLGEAIEKTDAATQGYTAHFMINCAHPNISGVRCEVKKPGGYASREFVRTHPRRVMLSWMNRIRLMLGTPASWQLTTRSLNNCFQISACWAGRSNTRVG